MLSRCCFFVNGTGVVVGNGHDLGSWVGVVGCGVGLGFIFVVSGLFRVAFLVRQWV